MSVWGISSTRDEDDILEASTRHMLAECDFVLIDDHCSVDATSRILERLRQEFRNRLQVQTDPDPHFDEVAKINQLVGRALRLGATWAVPFDTDEVWCSPDGLLREVLPKLRADYCIATVYEHVPQPADQGPNPLAAMTMRRQERWSWNKVCIRTDRGLGLTVGHHDVLGPTVTKAVADTSLFVRHFPYRSIEQAHRRVIRNAIAAAHAAHNWYYGGLTKEFHDPEVFTEWWAGLTDAEGLVYDPAPVRSA